MIARHLFILIPAVCALAAAPVHGQSPSKTASIVGEGNRPMGTVTLSQARNGVLLRIEASGLSEGWHGMHIHSVATCADAGFKASGGHVHPAGGPSIHGLLNPDRTELGDLPNIHAGQDGNAAAEVFVSDVSLGDAAGRLNLLDADGSALIIHAAPDDHVTQPIGGAGARVACAAIR